MAYQAPGYPADREDTGCNHSCHASSWAARLVRSPACPARRREIVALTSCEMPGTGYRDWCHEGKVREARQVIRPQTCESRCRAHLPCVRSFQVKLQHWKLRRMSKCILLGNSGDNKQYIIKNKTVDSPGDCRI